mmetsp:Transcript_28610/g.80602  ORF Transcript_28610/g.80602 Transcript_28610/m.80602 type:complete len:85 (-) Transcript_28610:243-497(-)
MGKYKKPRPPVIKEQPNMNSGKMECQREVNNFFECMGRYNFEIDSNCARESADLMACAEAASKKTKIKSTMNYHLQRIARLVRR